MDYRSSVSHSAFVESVYGEVVICVCIEEAEFDYVLGGLAAEVELVLFSAPAYDVSGGVWNGAEVNFYVAAVAYAYYNYSFRLCRGLSGRKSEHAEVEQGEFAIQPFTVLYADKTGLYGLVAYQQLVREVLLVAALVKQHLPVLAVVGAGDNVFVRSLGIVGVIEAEVLVSEVHLHGIYLVLLAKVNLQPFSTVT